MAESAGEDESIRCAAALGKGDFGTAYCVRKKMGSGGFLALKQVACQSTADSNDALQEAEMLQSLSHHKVVRYHDVFLQMDGGLLQVCKECMGSGICPHKRAKSQCKKCGGSLICEHNRTRSTCKECGGVQTR